MAHRSIQVSGSIEKSAYKRFLIWAYRFGHHLKKRL